MCGIIVSKGKYNNKFIQHRGPDETSVFEMNGYTFVHNLLHITGDKTLQPFVNEGIVALYNGEIYNHPYEKSDGEVIIPLYRKYGPGFVRHLDGEFAIALYDFEKDIILFSTDTFGTKPLWVNGDQCASYQSGVGGEKVPSNTLIVNGERETVHNFDFNTQHKKTYDDWIKAFETAVAKRAKDGAFLGLSSGYDSGGIACAVQKLGADCEAYSIMGQEDKDVLEKRGGRVLNITHGDIAYEQAFLDLNVEPYMYSYLQEGVQKHKRMHTDKAINGLGKICRTAKEEGRRVYLSGQGADEILCDYSKFPSLSELKGRFPEDLTEWSNFFGGFMESYLMKEEYIAGAYGIETRYPYLDTAVVQEFLWLTPELKNKAYKAPLSAYLEANNYPFVKDKKVGFNPVPR